MSELREDIKRVLVGINEADSDGSGWWETSTGAEFGQAKLDELLNLVSVHNKRIRDEAIDECGIAVGTIKARHWVHHVNNPTVEVIKALEAISALKENNHGL